MQSSWAYGAILQEQEITSKCILYQVRFLLFTYQGCTWVQAKFVGTPIVGSKKKAIWVPKSLVTNLQGPKQVWVPKRIDLLL
jgi:hypothetical protein